MLDESEFYRRFGQVELAPKSHPEYGRALYDRRTGVRRYELDKTESWMVDTKTGERAFRIGANDELFLPDGRAIANPKPLPPRQLDDTAQRLFAAQPAKKA